MLGPQREVVAGPPARKRRQVVRAGRDQRLGGIRVRRLEVARRVALEDQHAVRQHGVLGQRRAQLVGHGAEILADHEAAVAVALEREEPEQIVERIVDVGAVGRTPRPRGTQNRRARPIT